MPLSADGPARWDPHFAWAILTDGAGVTPQPSDWWPVAIELTVGAGAPPARQQLATALQQDLLRLPLVWRGRLAVDGPDAPRFVTGWLRRSAVYDAAFDPVWRLKPCFVGGAAPGARPRPPAPGDALRWLLQLEAGLASEVRQTVRAQLAHADAAVELPPAGGPDEPSSAQQTGPARGVAIGIIDFGCPFLHRHVRAADGSASRVAWLWDQGRSPGWQAAGGPPVWRAMGASWGYGRELDAAGMHQLREATVALRAAVGLASDDEAALEQACYALAGLPELLDGGTHGGHVLDLAGGTGAPPGQAPRDDAAGRAPLLFVQLPEAAVADLSGAWLARHVIDGIEYLLDKARALAVETLVVNLSYGNFAGPHDGRSVLEAALDHLITRQAGRTPRLEVVLPLGNRSRGRPFHVAGELLPGQTACFDWHVCADDPSQSVLELWHDAVEAGEVAVSLTPPIGQPLRVQGHGLAALTAGSDKAAAAMVLQLPGTRCGGRAAAQSSSSVQDGFSTLALLALAPTRELPVDHRWGVAAQAGPWSVTVSNLGPCPLRVEAWAERDEPGQGVGAARQPWVSAPADSPLQVAVPGSISALGGGTRTVLVDGLTVDVDPARPVAHYQPAGVPSRRLLRLSRRAAAQSEQGYRRGLLAAASLSGHWIRLEGTSMAAANATRQVANAGRFSPIQQKGQLPAEDITIGPGAA